MPATYEPIATTTLSTNTASVTFSSISGSYTDLVLVINAGTSNASEVDCLVRLNDDTGSNYSNTYLYGNGTSAVSGRNTNGNVGSAGYPIRPTLVSNIITQFQNYSNTTTYKTFIGKGGAADSMYLTTVNLWRNTAAITKILIYPSSGNFLSGSTFTLYGIKAA